MEDFIKRLKQCVRWFRQLEGNYVTEQEKLKNLLEVAEKKCSDVGKGYSFLIGYSWVFASKKEFSVINFFNFMDTARTADAREGK